MAGTDPAGGVGRGVVRKYDAADVRVAARRGLLGPWSARGRLRRAPGRRGLWVPEHTLRGAGILPYEEIDAGTNLWVNAGKTRLFNLLTAQGALQAYDATHTRIGVGNGTTAAAVTDIDLAAAAGSANRWFNPVDGAGTVTTTLAFTSTFATDDANFVWAEWGVDQGTSEGSTVVAPLFNRAVPAGTLGTKTSAAQWAFTVTLSVT